MDYPPRALRTPGPNREKPGPSFPPQRPRPGTSPFCGKGRVRIYAEGQLPRILGPPGTFLESRRCASPNSPAHPKPPALHPDDVFSTLRFEPRTRSRLSAGRPRRRRSRTGRHGSRRQLHLFHHKKLLENPYIRPLKRNLSRRTDEGSSNNVLSRKLTELALKRNAVTLPSPNLRKYRIVESSA